MSGCDPSKYDEMNQKLNFWYFGLGEFIFFAPLVCLRTIKVFNKFHMIADMCILVGITAILVFAIMQGVRNVHDGIGFIDGSGEGKPLINTDTCISFLGTAVFAFEGIGITCPVMDETKNKKEYAGTTLVVLILVGAMYYIFGLINYLVYSSTVLINSPLITNALNECNIAVDVIVLVYLFSVLLSYILNIFPANQIIESYLFKKMKGGHGKFWLINLSGCVVVAITVAVGIGLEATVGKLVSLLGSLAASPMAFVFPSGFHLSLMAETGWEKALDITIMALGIIYLIFGSFYTLYTWNVQ